MARPLARVDIQGTRPDGSSFLIRTWAEVEEVRRPGENRSRWIVEVRQPFVWGVPAGPLTTQTLRRYRVAARRRNERRTQDRRARESEHFRERLRVAREAIEEYGVPAAHARWSPEDTAGRRRVREEEEWQRNVRSRAATADGDRHEGEGGPRQETAEEQRVDMEEEVQPATGQEQEPVAGPSDWQEGQEQEPMAGPPSWQEIPGNYQGDYEGYGDEPEDWDE